MSCLTPKRSEIQATIWLNNTPLPAELCIQHPELNEYGFYRKLNDGKLEFVSFCSEDAKDWLSMHNEDFNRLMDKYVPNVKGK